MLEIFLGDRFSNLRIAFPLSRWRPLPLPPSSSSQPLSYEQVIELARPITSGREPKVERLPSEGIWVYLIGTDENEFWNHWEGSVMDGVRRGLRGVTLVRS